MTLQRASWRNNNHTNKRNTNHTRHSPWQQKCEHLPLPFRRCPRCTTGFLPSEWWERRCPCTPHERNASCERHPSERERERERVNKQMGEQAYKKERKKERKRQTVETERSRIIWLWCLVMFWPATFSSPSVFALVQYSPDMILIICAIHLSSPINLPEILNWSYTEKKWSVGGR